MIIRTTKDIPEEIKNLVEQYYLQDSEHAQSEAIRLGFDHPEWKPLLNHVSALFSQAPESVFSFYEELIRRFNASDAVGDKDEIAISLDNLLKGLTFDNDSPEDSNPTKKRHRSITGIPSVSYSAMRTPVPKPIAAASSAMDDGFEIDIDFDEDVPATDVSTLRPQSEPSASSSRSQDDMPLFDLSSMFDDPSSLENSSPSSKSAVKPSLDIASIMDDTPIHSRSPHGLHPTREIIIANEMTKSPFDVQSKRAFHSSELQRLRSNLSGGADIMRAVNQNAFSNDASSSRQLLGDARRSAPKISALSPHEGRVRANTVSGVSWDGEDPRPTAVNLTSVPSSGLKRGDEFRSTKPAMAPISLNEVQQKPVVSVEGRATAVQLPAISSTSGSGPRFASIPEVGKTSAVGLSTVNAGGQRPSDDDTDTRQTILSMSPVARVARQKLDPEEGKRALEFIQPITRVPQLQCKLSEISKRKDINPRAGFILSMIDGVTTISDILDISAWPEPETAQLLLELEQHGVIAFV